MTNTKKRSKDGKDPWVYFIFEAAPGHHNSAEINAALTAITDEVMAYGLWKLDVELAKRGIDLEYSTAENAVDVSDEEMAKLAYGQTN